MKVVLLDEIKTVIMNHVMDTRFELQYKAVAEFK